MTNFDIEIFKGKTFKDLTRDIYKNVSIKKKKINVLIKTLMDNISSSSDAVVLAPIIKEYMDVLVKNDEHLVKLAGILQKVMLKSNDSSEDSTLLSEYEKEELLSTLEEVTTDLQKNVDKTPKKFMDN
tara:strand:- start:765 stop:1148 length:384 start_codon:yes stop_codon:yes gene_type:complete